MRLSASASQERRPNLLSPLSKELEPLRHFVNTQILPDSKNRDHHYLIPHPLYQGLFDLGWWNAFIPKSLGGVGLSTVDLCHVLKLIAYGSPGMATSFAANMVALITLLQLKDKKLKREIFDEVLSKFSFASFCFTEAESGSDLLSIKTTATSVPAGYILNGSKCFITNANHSQHLVVVAKQIDIQDPRKSMSIFYVPRNYAGVSTGKPIKKMGQRDSNTSEIFLDHVFVPATHRVGTEGEALSIASFSLQRSRTLLAASCVGLCERASDLTKAHLTQRILYSKPLLEQSVIRCFLAQLHTEMHAAWHLTLAAAKTWDAGKNQVEVSSMAKLFAAQTAVKFSHGTMELFGGWGYSEEFEIERIYRDAKLYETLEGPTFVLQTLIAKELFPKRFNHSTLP